MMEFSCVLSDGLNCLSAFELIATGVRSAEIQRRTRGLNCLSAFELIATGLYEPDTHAVGVRLNCLSAFELIATCPRVGVSTSPAIVSIAFRPLN